MPRPQPSESGISPLEDNRKFLSPKEFVAVSGISLATVHRRLKSKQLPKYQPGGPGTRIMIPVDAIEISTPAADSGRNGQRISSTATNVGRTDKVHLSGRRPHWMSTVHINVADRKNVPSPPDETS
jgi:hypothetical protein